MILVIDGYEVGKRATEDGIRFYIPPNASTRYVERYCMGREAGIPRTEQARATKEEYAKATRYGVINPTAIVRAWAEPQP